MGFGFYPDGTKQETAGPIKEIDKPIPVANDITPSELKPKEDQPITPTHDVAMSKQQFVIDTFHNATAVNTDRRADVVADLKGFAEGSPTAVTYYHRTEGETDVKGLHKLPDVKTHKAHKSMLKIHGFEIRMLGNLNHEHDTADNVTRYTGEAVTYPGFTPMTGDTFIMEIDIGKFGEMVVTDAPTRMAIKSSTYYKITFSLRNWMSEDRYKELDEFVISEAWFDKKRFLNEPGALLYHNEYVEMKYLDLHSARLVTYYNNKFLDKILMFSYMRPDGVYDPYITDFMLKITEYGEAGQIAAQLFRDAPAIETSIWRALLSEVVPLESVPTSAVIATRTLGSKTVMANSLLNRRYVAWEPNSPSLAEFFDAEDAGGAGDDVGDGDPSVSVLADAEKDKIVGDLLLHIHPHFRECVLTCCGDCQCCGDVVCDDTNTATAYILDGGDEYKSLIRLFLKERKINTHFLVNCIKNAYKLPPIQQFYKMPVLIYLARTAIRYIHAESGIFE